ncbi:MAG: SPASM domain-containing protein [Planctomycetes bacterium]|nr:SPASM domain-containing protein [Planctomycetota bacterium]MCC7172758.1 SPASM domain-containing protein [Planctomycetota bacterium]
MTTQRVATLPATAAHPREFVADPGRQQVHPDSIPHLHSVTNLDFDVTENCNLGCLYCFKGEMYTKNMSLETMKKALEWLFEASGTATSVNCNFMGGEPTMRWKEIRQFLPWARRRGAARGKHVTFSMTSNLTLFTDEIRDAVDRYGFGLLMSIDGCPDVQDAQRPAKNGQKMSAIVEHWAKSLLRTRPASTARATIHPKYADRVFDSMRYFKEIGFREVSVSLSEYHAWDEAALQALQHGIAQTVDFCHQQHRAGDPFELTLFRYTIGKLIHPRATGRDAEIGFMPSPCGAGKGYMMVDYTGDIWPCHRFDGADAAAGAGGGFRMGNIFGGQFDHALQKGFIDFDHSKMHKDSCTRCPVNPICGGYCPAANLSDTGSIYTPHDVFCGWSQLMYAAAEELYRRIAADGEESLARLVASAKSASSDGQK